MQKVAERPKANKALLVTGVVMAVVAGVALAERYRRRSLAARQRSDITPDPIPWGIVGYSDL
jgi:hypothetical protein